MISHLPPGLLPDMAPGTVWLVGAGPGDPGLLTLQALHALRQADVILHDALVGPQILGLADPAADLVDVGKRAGTPGQGRQDAINDRLVALARAGLRVVRLKGGDPFLFGRGGEEALALARAHVTFRVVPGISAGLAGLAAAGIPVTHRGLAHSAAFVTGHAAHHDIPVDIDWTALARGADVLVFFMALRTIGRIADRLMAAGRPADEPVAFIADATLPGQRVSTASLLTAGAVADGLERSRPTLIAVGPVVALHAVLAAWAAPVHSAVHDLDTCFADTGWSARIAAS